MNKSNYPEKNNCLPAFTEFPADSMFMVEHNTGNNFIITYAAPSFLDKINKSTEEVVNAEIATVFSAEEAALLKMHMLNCVINNTVASFKYVSGIKGKNQCVAMQLFPVPCTKDRPQQLTCISKDLTEQDCYRQDAVNNKILMKNIYDFFPEGILISDDKGYIIECNTSTEELLGISREESSAMTVHEKLRDIEVYKPDYTMLPPEEYPSAIALKQKTVVKNHVVGLSRKNEEMVWVNSSSAWLNLPGYGVVTSYTDITEQKKTAEKTNALKNTLDAILNSSSDCLLFLDTALKVVLCNTRAHQFAVEFLGRDVTEGEYIMDLITCERKHIVLQYLKQVENREEVIAEEKIRFLSGEERWYYTRYYPAYNERKEYIGCVLNYTDITERKNNELRLQQQHEQLKMQETLIRKTKTQFETLINSSSDFILLLDAEMNVVLYNEVVKKTAMKFLKKSNYDVLSFLDLPEENQHNLKRCIKQVEETGKPVFLESRLFLGQGVMMLLYSKYFPVFDDAGNYAGCTLIVTDITSIKQKELQIEEQNSQLKKLVEIQEKQNEELISTRNILQSAIDSSSDVIAFLDLNYNKVFCNIAAEGFVQAFFDKTVNVGDHLFDFVPEQLHPKIATYIQQSQANKPFNIEEKLVHKNGTFTWYQIRFFPTKNVKGESIGCFINLCDITKRKEAQLQLENQNEQLRLSREMIKETKNQLEALINSSSDYIILLDTDMKVVLYNSTASEASLTHFGKPYRKGASLMEFLPPKNREACRSYIQQVKDTGKAVSAEGKLDFDKGYVGWLYNKFFPVYDDYGTYIGCTVISTDISIIKQKEVQIEEQNELLKQLVEVQQKQQQEIIKTGNILQAIINSSPDNIVFLDNNFRIALFNKKANESSIATTGRYLQVGDYSLEHTPAEQRATTLASLKQAQNGKEIILESNALYDDETVWYAVKYYPAYNEKEETIGCVVIYSDITKRKQIELQLHEQNKQLKENEAVISETKNQLEAVINSSSDNILFLNRDNKVLLYNKAAFVHFLKLSNKPLKQGENILQYIPGYRHELFNENLDKLKERKVLELEQEVVYPDGDKVWFYRKYYPVYSEMDNYIGYVINSSNIDKRKIFELKLSKQNEQLREIARIQSHELRRPLANIMGLVNLLTDEKKEDGNADDLLLKLKISAEALDDVIRKITGKTIPC